MIEMNKKDCKRLIKEFDKASQPEKAKMWNSMVPYLNAYPEIWQEYREKNNKTGEMLKKRNEESKPIPKTTKKK